MNPIKAYIWSQTADFAFDCYAAAALSSARDAAPAQGLKHAAALLARHVRLGLRRPETIASGQDNPYFRIIAQVLHDLERHLEMAQKLGFLRCNQTTLLKRRTLGLGRLFQAAKIRAAFTTTGGAV
jgi:hypothetical protein